MKSYHVSDVLKQILIYTIFVFIMFGSRDTWISYHNSMIMCVNMVLSLGSLGVLVLYQKRICHEQFKVILFLFVLVIGSMISNLDFSGYSMFVVLTIALFAEESFEFGDFYRNFENFIFGFTLLSLLGCALWIAHKDGGLLIFRLVHIASNEVVPWGFRLYGIFREPAMYCIYLGLGLARCLLAQKKKNCIKIMVYLLAILLTASTTGYIATAFLFVCYFFLEKNKSRWFLLYLLLFAVMGIWAINHGVGGYFVSRISMTGRDAVSSNSRYFSIIGGAIVGLMHPWFGAGAIKSATAFEKVLIDLIGKSYCWANMITYLWASFGCIFAYIFLRGIYGVLSDKKKSVSLAFFLFICLLLCGETMTYSSIMYIFMFYGYKKLPLGKIRCRNARKEVNIHYEGIMDM